MATNPKKPARWEEIKVWMIDDLTDEERLYARRWIARYVNRWGQIPVASAHQASRAFTKPWESKRR